ncbi:hypothetical protein A8D95_20740 [Burkholderia cenocepacia]|nr:hypothetical protein A8D83_03435 [Burkholderia cenocepacia]ONJ27774.1 hypothetical protein A8D90_14805 [Burkholderia cenocepacia]ONP28419.1 hypothetical protein A8D84_17140 [Burkholderia cenocepacia]ONP39670.1 hypothetical protein A8D85_14700 [Burkholderia cenocepacia]ONP44394.1 hypothetical protein A8D86_13785 [Burkholderia cenocepacia]
MHQARKEIRDSIAVFATCCLLESADCGTCPGGAIVIHAFRISRQRRRLRFFRQVLLDVDVHQCPDRLHIGRHAYFWQLHVNLDPVVTGRRYGANAGSA